MTNKAPESSIINDAFLKFKRGVKYIERTIQHYIHPNTP